MEKVVGPLFTKLFLQYILQAEGDIGIFARIFIHLFGGEVAHVLLVFPLGADKFLDGDGAVVEEYLGQIIHAVVQFGREYIVGHHGVEERACKPHSVLRQHQEVVLDVLAHFSGLGIGEYIAELFDDGRCFGTVGRYGDIPCFAFGHTEAHPHQFRSHWLGACGLCV